MKIGFDFADIKMNANPANNGQYAWWLYNLFLRDMFQPSTDRKRSIVKKELIQGKYVIELSKDDIPDYAEVVAHKDNIYWDGFDVFVEIADANRDTNVPAWLPDLRDGGLDENEQPIINTLGDVALREALDGTKFAIKISDISKTQLENLEAAGSLALNKMSVKEAGVVFKGTDYALPES